MKPLRTDTTTQPKPRRSLTHARYWSDLYCLWRFCGKQACRRSRTCKGAPRMCFRALPLVPPDALAFMQAFDDGLSEWLSFDEVMERNEDAWAAVEDWHELVMSTLPDSEKGSAD